MKQAIYDHLKEIARKRDLIPYKKLADSTEGMRWPEHRRTLFNILDEINGEEVCCHGRPMLSAVVVVEDDNFPGSGFFECAKKLGRWREGSEEEFYYEELRKVWDFWQADKR